MTATGPNEEIMTYGATKYAEASARDGSGGPAMRRASSARSEEAARNEQTPQPDAMRHRARRPQRTAR